MAQVNERDREVVQGIGGCGCCQDEQGDAELIAAYREEIEGRYAAHAETLVDVIGEALGVDTGTISATRFAHAVEAARAALAKLGKG